MAWLGGALAPLFGPGIRGPDTIYMCVPPSIRTSVPVTK
jgi:hypothetical protein